MHLVAVVAMDGVLPFEVSMPCEVFGRAAVPGSSASYAVRVCGQTPAIKAGAFDLRVPFGLDQVAGAHTVMLPGIADPTMPIPDDVVAAVQEAARRGARIASICTGAFVLAATGLLDGCRATTHWRAAALLAKRHPDVQVDAGVLFVDNGRTLTSAGAVAGMDLCLHMIQRDLGAAAAADAARLAVMPLRRDGGQAQFIMHKVPASPATLEPLLRWMDQNLHRALSLEEVAGRAAMTTRTLSRRFRQQVGTTPIQWMLAARVQRAQLLLETTGMSVEGIAAQVGFGCAAILREHFCRIVGTSPAAYRRAMGAPMGHVRPPLPGSLQPTAGRTASAEPVRQGIGKGCGARTAIGPAGLDDAAGRRP